MTKWKYALAVAENAPGFYLVTDRLFKGRSIAHTFTEADACKIAAIPDMLEALHLFNDLLDEDDCPPHLLHAYRVARAALLKAEAIKS